VQERAAGHDAVLAPAHEESRHDSDNRSLTNAADLRKREFLGKLKPKIKQLYFDVATKASVYDAIALNAATHADTNRARIEQILKTAGQGRGKKKIDALLERVATAPLTTNFPPEALQHYVYSPEFKNIWEISYKTKMPKAVLGTPARWAVPASARTRSAGSATRRSRRAIARTAPLHGREHQAQPEGRRADVRPLLLRVEGRGQAACDVHGARHLRHGKDADVKDIDQEELVGTADNMEATLAHNPRALRALGHEYEGDDEEAEKEHAANAFYIEAQVHGGLDARDAKALWVNYSKRNTADMDKPYRVLAEAFSAKWGAPIKHYAGG